MADAVAQAKTVWTLPADTSNPSKAMILATIAHGLLWSVTPALLIGNLHADTLEAIYWGSEWALGYGKHPPIATWLLDAAVGIGVAPIFCVLVASQVTVAIASFFVYRTIRLYQGASTAALGVLLFLVSPAASFYAVQINHNTVLAPFWAACAFFGLRYLEERRSRDAIVLGLVAGLGLVAKYEILFILATLVMAAALVPRFRWAFGKPVSYFSVVLMFLVASPHIWWLAHHGWPSVDRALGIDKVVNIDTLNLSAVNALIGQFTLFALPAAVLLCVTPWRREIDLPSIRSGARTGALLAFAPSLVLLAGAVGTDQVVKPLWVLPLASSAAVGVALMFPAQELGRARAFAVATVMASAVILLCFFSYLLISDAIGRPVTAYEPNARILADAVRAEWRAHQKTPVACLVIAERKLGPSPLLWLKPMPNVVDYSSGFWHTPALIAQCLRSGAVIVDASSDQEAQKDYAPACVVDVRHIKVPARFSLRGATWRVRLAYVPPESQKCPP